MVLQGALKPTATISLPTRRTVCVPAVKGARQNCVMVRATSNIGGPYPPDPTPRPPGTPSIPTPPVFRVGGTPGTGGAGGPTGPTTGFGGTGGSGNINRPVATGGHGGYDSGPSGPTLSSIIWAALGIAAGVAAWRYLNRRYIFKPEPEHTIAKVEDAAAHARSGGKGTLSKAGSAIKHATVDPIKDMAAAVKHSDTGRTVQHSVEDVKDSADIGLHKTGNRAERAMEHGKKSARHAVDDVTTKAGDVGAGVDSRAHEVGVKGSRSVQRGKEKVSDAAYDAEVASARAGRGVFEGIKGAAKSAGRALHVMGDATEKGGRKVARAGEDATGTRYRVLGHHDRKNLYYATGGVLLGSSVLALLYYYDKKGGDLRGRLNQLQKTTKEAADVVMDKTKDVLHRSGMAHEPAKPPPAAPPAGSVF